MTEESGLSTETVASTTATAERPWRAVFFTIWTGQALSLVGSRMADFALVWWLTQASGGSATTLAAASMLALLPRVVIGPIAGVLVDRMSRRRLMIAADSLVALFSLGLGVIAWMGILRPWHVFIFVFARSLGGLFHGTAMQAATSMMVPKEQLTRVSGMNQTLQGAMNIISPPLGALAVSALSLPVIMGIDIVTAAFAVGPLLFVSIADPASQQRDAADKSVATLLRGIREGFAYIWDWPGMVIVLATAALLNALVNPAFSLAPVLVTKRFGGGALQLGWLDSAWGIGLILGGLTLSVWGGFKRRIYTSLLGLVGMGLALAMVGLVPPSLYNLALGFVFVAGFMNTLTNGPLFAILQGVVAPEMQGRVFAAVGSLAGLAAPIGMAVAGPVADAFGPQIWFIAGGVTTLIMGLALRAVPAVVDLEHGRGDVPTEDETASVEPAPGAAGLG